MVKTISETVDMLCLIIILIGTLVFFSVYFSEDYRLRYAMHLTEAFFDEAEQSQQVTEEAYEKLIVDLKAINSRYEIVVRMQRGDEIHQKEDLLAEFEKQDTFPLYSGDVITFCLHKGKEKCAVMQRIVWW